MSPSSLVAESVIRLMQQRSPPASEEHLRGLATVFMARVLADDARSRLRAKRGGRKKTLSLDAATTTSEADATGPRRPEGPIATRNAATDRDELIAAMLVVAQTHPRAMEVVTLHLVGGIDLSRTAELIGISDRTAYRDLEIGRAELARHIDAKHHDHDAA